MTSSRLHESALTRREWQIVSALVAGQSNIDIASHLGISPLTVRNALSMVYLKTGATNRVRLTRLVLTGRLLPPP